ncbi:MAG: hypothetical protein WBV46_21760 [Terriglobales bacterium]|jgi:hypothetical protein
MAFSTLVTIFGALKFAIGSLPQMTGEWYTNFTGSQSMAVTTLLRLKTEALQPLDGGAVELV